MMQGDVRSAKVTASGTVAVERTRIKGVYYVAGASAGSVNIRENTVGGTVRVGIDTPAAATATQFLLLPGEGVLVEGTPYVELTNVTSATIFYG